MQGNQQFLGQQRWWCLQLQGWWSLWVCTVWEVFLDNRQCRKILGVHAATAIIAVFLAVAPTVLGLVDQVEVLGRELQRKGRVEMVFWWLEWGRQWLVFLL